MTTGLAVVTGASAGIGWEMARQLAARGYDLLAIARREERLAKLAQQVSSESSRKVECMRLDLAVPEERRKLVSALYSAAEKLSLVVNNAGFGIAGPTVQSPFERIARLIELDITALTELSYEAAKIMIKKKSGALINVASTAAFQAVPYMNAYSAAKAYVLSFTEALAEELSEHGIRVMALCPGYTKTEFQAVAGVVRDDVRFRSVMSAADCVRTGLEDFDNGKRISITGTGNKLMVFGSWLAPRRLVIKAAAKMMRDRA